MRPITIFICVAVALVVTLFAVQFRLLSSLRQSVAALEEQLRAAQNEKVDVPPSPKPRERIVVQPGDWQQRLARLEERVIKLADASEYLMERGALPLESNKLSGVINRLLDATLPDSERLAALRLLRRNGAMSDAVVQGALGWLQASTDADMRREVLQQLDGVTNAVAKQPLLNLALNDADPEVRQEAMENLRQFVRDPHVEQRLWEALRHEQDPDVREEAEDTLSRGPVDAARLASLRQRILDPNSSLDERITALQAIRRADDPPSDVMRAMAELAQTTPDASARARLFSAFDGAEDPAFKLPLVNGLQDPSPRVREEAADALSGYKSDPAVAEWLKYVAANDEDSRVRREAEDALSERGR